MPVSKTLQDFRTEAADCVEKARLVHSRLTADGKKDPAEWTDAEHSEFNQFMAAADAANERYKKQASLSQNVDRLNSFTADLDMPEPARQRQIDLSAGSNLNAPLVWNSLASRTEYANRNSNRFSNKLQRSWEPTQPSSQNAYASGTAEYTKDFNKWLRGSRAAEAKLASTGMSSDNEERGGYFQTSETFMSEIIKNVDDSVFVQGLSRVIMMPPAKQLGVRVRRQRASTFQWAGENTDTRPTRDTSLLYGKRYLIPNYLQGSTIISRDLLRNVPQAEAMVIEEIGVDLNYKLEPAFIAGDGNMKPLGLMVASADGISTARDFTSAATAFTFDDWSNLKYSLKMKYRSNATWMLHRNVLAATALLKDNNGRYLWEPSRTVGSPDVILGNPVVETEWMPSAVTSGLYYSIFGDFSYYWIVYEMGMEMQRLIETQAYTNEVEYLFRCKLDAQPVLEEAFSRGKRA